MRSVTASEESEFQSAVTVLSSVKSILEATPETEETLGGDSGYAVMIRIKTADRWTWTTWMYFETEAEAMTCARDGMKVVRFRSPEWMALRQESQAVSSVHQDPSSEQYDPRGEGETLAAFVLRFLSTRI